MNRERLLERVEERPFDLIVIGAGINGAGIARDAAMRG
jgi:glycerol-3-phosphate dehydrogenase